MIYMQNPIKQRYYLLLIEQDLFGTWYLKRVFGSLVNRRGRILIQAFTSKQAAWHELTEIEYKKRQRGYLYIDTALENFHLKPQTIAELKAQLQTAKSHRPKDILTPEAYNNPAQQSLFANIAESNIDTPSRAID